MNGEIAFKNSNERIDYDTFQDRFISSDPEQLIPKMSSQQNRIIFAIAFVSACIEAQYGSISTFFIPFKNKNHSSVSDFQVGLIIAIFEVGSLFSYLFVPNVMFLFGRKNTLLLALSQSFIASIGLGFCSYIQDDFSFYIATLLLRFYQGFAVGHIYVACFAIASSEFIQKRGQVISYLEAAIGLGLIMGSPIGQTFSVIISYQFIFFGFGILIISSVIVSIILLPNKLNQYFGEQDQIMDNLDVEEVSYGKIFTNVKVLNSLFFTTTGVVAMLFNVMLITNQLVAIEVPLELTGYILGISGISFVVFNAICGSFVDRIENYYLVQASFITSSLSLFLQGSSTLFQPISNSLVRMLIGQILTNLSIALILPSMLPNIIVAVEQKEKLIANNDQLIDKASTLYNLSFTFSCLIAPLLGGYLSDNFGYTKSCDIMGISSALLGILYFLVSTLIKKLKA